jgi:hypothetical protein
VDGWGGEELDHRPSTTDRDYLPDSTHAVAHEVAWPYAGLRAQDRSRRLRANSRRGRVDAYASLAMRVLRAAPELPTDICSVASNATQHPRTALRASGGLLTAHRTLIATSSEHSLWPGHPLCLPWRFPPGDDDKSSWHVSQCTPVGTETWPLSLIHETAGRAATGWLNAQSTRSTLGVRRSE